MNAIVLSVILNIFFVGALRLNVEDKSTPKFVYGFLTADVIRYTKMLEAQMNTWASHVPREDIIIVGGPHDTVGGSICQETLLADEYDQECKEAVLYYNAAHRARNQTLDWLVALHEDAYVFRKPIEKILANYDPDEPIVFGHIGCGRFWAYRDESKGNTLPKPNGWEDTESCTSVHEKGGICGGPGYIWSRGALKAIAHPDHSIHQHLEAYRSHTKRSSHVPCDLAAACVGYANDVKVQGFPQGLADTNAQWAKDVKLSNSTIQNMEFWKKRDFVSVIHVLGPKEDIPAFHELMWKLEQDMLTLTSGGLASPQMEATHTSGGIKPPHL